MKNVMNNPSRGIKDTFEKVFKSNAVGDEFIDPGQYFLRKADNTKLYRNSVIVGGPAAHTTNFKSSGGNKLVRKSEFEHLHNGPPPRPASTLKKNFLTRFTAETFQSKIMYTEDLYETKEDLTKQDYVNRRNQILAIERPYTTTVKQHGTFYP
jgi:hypothetical protein